MPRRPQEIRKMIPREKNGSQGLAGAAPCTMDHWEKLEPQRARLDNAKGLCDGIDLRPFDFGQGGSKEGEALSIDAQKTYSTSASWLTHAVACLQRKVSKQFQKQVYSI